MSQGLPDPFLFIYNNYLNECALFCRRRFRNFERITELSIKPWVAPGIIWIRYKLEHEDVYPEVLVHVSEIEATKERFGDDRVAAT